MTTSVTITQRNLAHLISLDTIESFIAVGRAKVKGTSLDPYAKVKNSQVAKAIANDAAAILKWYKRVLKQGKRKWVRRASRSIMSIQHGPKKFNATGKPQ